MCRTVHSPVNPLAKRTNGEVAAPAAIVLLDRQPATAPPLGFVPVPSPPLLLFQPLPEGPPAIVGAVSASVCTTLPHRPV